MYWSSLHPTQPPPEKHCSSHKNGFFVSFFLSRFWFFFTLLILSLSRYFSPGSHPPPPQKEYFAKYIYPWEIKIMFTYLGQLLVLFYHILNFLFQVFNLKLYIHIFFIIFFCYFISVTCSFKTKLACKRISEYESCTLSIPLSCTM